MHFGVITALTVAYLFVLALAIKRFETQSVQIDNSIMKSIEAASIPL